MDRNREARRGTMAATNGLSKRRHRSSSLRDSPEEDGGAVEFQETTRLRERSSKKDRDRDRSSRSKRRRGDRLIQGSNREEGGEESTEESADDDEEDEDEVVGTVRMLPPNPVFSSLQSNHHQRKSFPPTKVVRTAPWKVSDEMGFSVPKKARSASVKRSQECWISGGGGGVDGEKILRQASTSPARPSVVAPTSPSSSNASLRKKMKHIGPKHRLPKVSNKPSSNQEEIEIEVAEVLYGLMRQTYCPSRPEVITNLSQKLDSKDTNGSSNDAKSRVSSPISVSPPSGLQPSILPQNSSSSITHLPVVAPKRKRPRHVKIEEESPAIFTVRNGSISSVSNKIENEQPAKIEISSPKLDKISGSTGENGGAVAVGLLDSQPQSAKPESNTELDSQPLAEASEVRDGDRTKDEVASIRNEYPPCAKSDVDIEDATVTNAISTISEGENQREEKFKIDLMALPSLKSSPERNGVIDPVSDSKSVAPVVEMTEIAPKEEKKLEKSAKQEPEEASLPEKMDAMVPDFESQNSIACSQRILDLQIDLEKQNKDSVGGTNNQQNQKQQQQQSRNEPKSEKAVQSTSLPLSMTVAGWPGGLPPLGYSMGQVRPLQGIVPLDGNAGASPILQPPQFLLSQQSRLKRCATHFLIAQNIHYHQQFTRMNPFWPSAPGSASLYGTKAYNLNVVPPTETAVIGNQSQGSHSGRNFNSSQEKGQVEVAFSGNVGKDKSSVAATNFVDAVQRKQLVLQQAPQPAVAGNLMPTPAFIFPMNHQQAAAAVAMAGNRSGPVKSASAIASVVSSIAANSASGSSSSTAAVTAPTVSFNYQNLPPNETQYLAILQNNAYPFPFPAPVAAPPPFRGEPPHPQAISFFNGPFYPSQMHHPPQLQQQQQPVQSHTQPQQGHPNTSTSSGSSSSQKHQQLQSGGGDGGIGNSHRFSVSKNRHQQQQQPSQKQQNQSITTLQPQVYQLGADMSVDDSSLTGDCRVSQAHHKSVYNQNFSMPMHPKNSALMSSPAALSGSGSGNHGEKQQQQQQQRQSQQHSLKGGIEFIPSQAFFNGAAPPPGLDFSSMPQNHPIFQSVNVNQIAAAAAAAQAAQQKKTQVSDSVSAEDERKAMAGKGVSGSVEQSLVFSRADSTDNPLVSTISGTENSARPGSGNRTSRSNASVVGTTGMPSSTVSTPNSQHQQQQHQVIHLQKQQHMQQQHQLQQQLAAAAQPKPNNARANVYPDRLPSSSMAKFPNAHPVFPQGYIQAGGIPAQPSPQWKNSTRSTPSPVSSHSLNSTTAPLKNLPQQQVRNEQGHMQISFGGVNPKSGATASQGQNQSASPPVIVGSPPPPTTSIPKSSGGSPSPRTTSTGSKAGGPAPSTLSSSSQQVKNSSGPSRKSSPIPNVMTAPSSSTKAQSQQHQQQQQQQQSQKHALQQAHLYYSNAYMQAQAQAQAQSPHTTTSTTSASPSSMGYYHPRRQTEPQQKQGPSYTSTGMLLCPSLTLAGATTSDPAKAVAAAANNMKGGGGLLQAAQFATQSGGNPHPFMSAVFPYMHSVPTAQVKSPEQKQPTGNDNLHTSSQSEKR